MTLDDILNIYPFKQNDIDSFDAKNVRSSGMHDNSCVSLLKMFAIGRRQWRQRLNEKKPHLARDNR